MLAITKDEALRMPAFLNHESARSWFKNKYGNRFVMQKVEWINGDKIYIYHLVKNRDVYLKHFDQIRSGEVLYSMELLNSFQPIEIWKDGRIHVVH